MARQPEFTGATASGAVTVAAPLAPAPSIPSRSLVASVITASAVSYKGSKAPRVYHPVEEWQRECYRHYGICGEARYAADFMGHAYSRAVLEVVKDSPGKPRETLETGPAVDLLEELFSGKDGQAQMLQSAGVHMTVAGEFYLVGRETAYDIDDPTLLLDAPMDIWEIVSVIEMRKTGTEFSIVHEGYMPIVLGDDAVVIRVYNPDPSERTKAFSPFKSLLPVLREIEWLTLHIFAQCTSRLATMGLMFIDQDLDFEPPKGADGKPIQVANKAQGLMLVLAQAMNESMKDPEAVLARSPIAITVPSATLQKGKPAELLRFWTDLDDKARDLRNDSIKRFALGLEMPPEQLLGMSSNSGTGGGTSNGVSHWGAWQIEESTIKMFVEPGLETVCNAITIGYLRLGMFDEETDESTYDGEKLAANTKNLRLRPDRSKEASELNQDGILTDEVRVKENGFNVEDMMDDAQFKRWLMRKIATGSPTPGQIAAAVAFFGGDIPADDGVPTAEQRGEPNVRSLEDHPTRPRDPSEQVASLLPVYESLALRALERAGNRLRQANGGAKVPGVAAYEVHTTFAANGNAARVLADAWTTVPIVLEGTGVDPAKATDCLNAYCLSLVTSQKPHTRAALTEFMERAS